MEAFRRPVRCDPADVPFEVAGPRLGILGGRGEADGEIEPPYDIELAELSSAPRYERA